MLPCRTGYISAGSMKLVVSTPASESTLLASCAPFTMPQSIHHAHNMSSVLCLFERKEMLCSEPDDNDSRGFHGAASASPSIYCTRADRCVSLILGCALQCGGGSCLVVPPTWGTRTDQALSMARRAPGEVCYISLHTSPTTAALAWAACATCLG